VWKDEVISMTVVARRCNDETTLEQALAVDTLRIVAQDVVFRNVVDPGNWCSLTVTLAAENRDVHLVGAGSDIAGGKNVVVPMAFAAGWGIGSTAFKSAAMNSCIKFLIGVIVADSAVNSLERFRMRKILHICILMAIDTGGVFVH